MTQPVIPTMASTSTDGTVTLIFVDVPLVQFGTPASAATETVGTFNVSVAISHVTTYPVTVNLSYGGTATGGGVDYSGPGQITIPAGELTAPIPLALTADSLTEPDETIRITLTSLVGAANLGTSTVHVATILDVSSARPKAPVLVSPANRSNVAIVPTRLTWKAVTGAIQYRLQVDDDPAFGSPIERGTGSGLFYLSQMIDDLTYGTTSYWRVQAADTAYRWSNWSAVYSFTLTNLRAPTNGTFMTSIRPSFAWTAITGAARYDLQVDNNADFTSPEADLLWHRVVVRHSHVTCSACRRILLLAGVCHDEYGGRTLYAALDVDRHGSPSHCASGQFTGCQRYPGR